MSGGDTYTVGHAVDALGFGRYQMFLSAAVGFAYMADAMEMMILSVLAPALHCYWHISQVQQANLTTVVFLGMMLSSSFWGTLADKYGRRPTLIWTTVFLFYFGLLTSFAPTFNWVLFLRFLVGFYIGGVPQACTLYAEYLPSSVRGKAIMVLCFFWAAGAAFLAFLAWAVMPTLGWRYLVALSTMPMAIFILVSPLLPESLFYLAATGQKERVETQLNRMATINKKPALIGDLVLDETSKEESRGSIKDMFASGRRRLTVQIWILWFIAAAIYYGVVLLSTELLNSSSQVCLPSGASPIDGIPGESRCSLHKCQGLSSRDYVELIWTTVAEFPGAILAMVLIDWIGRKKTLAFQSFLFAISTLCVMECSMSRNLLVVVLFCSRGLAAGMFQSVYVYTPEAYPTHLRALAMGSGSTVARIGAMLTPYVAHVLLKTSLYSAIGVYAAMGIVAAVTAWFLPVETLGTNLADAGHQDNKGRTQLVNQEETTRQRF